MVERKFVANSLIKELPSDKKDPRFQIRTTQQMASACGGALLTSFLITPLDVVKTRIQAQQKALLSNRCFLYCNGLMDHLCPCIPPSNQPLSKKPPLHLNGTFDAILKISRHEGITSLWSGLSPTLVLALPATVIYFVAYEKFREKYCSLYTEKIANIPTGCRIPLVIPLVAGCSARLVAVSIVSPLELIRTKMQSERLSYFRLYQALKATINNQGITGLWRGLTSTIYRDVPFSGIYWTSYELLRASFLVGEASFGFSFLAGAISGSSAAFITTPFDVVKTHKQIEFGEKVIYADKPAKDIPSETTFTSLKRIYLAHGVKGLFAGLGARLAKVAPACAIMIASFEYGKSFFYQYNIQKYMEEKNFNQTLSYDRSK